MTEALHIGPSTLFKSTAQDEPESGASQYGCDWCNVDHVVHGVADTAEAAAALKMEKRLKRISNVRALRDRSEDVCNRGLDCA